MSENKDIFGTALWDYYQFPADQELITWTSLTEEDAIPVKYFFREFNQMPAIEQKALELCVGKVLDVGCGAGSHGLYLNREQQLEVWGIDTSPGAIKTAAQRGLKKVVNQSVFDYHGKTFDTLLLLMNGPGICGKLENLKKLFEKLKSLLNPGGQILLDSSDLIYLFDQTDLGEKIIPGENYYGDLEYGIRYNHQSATFPWLYVGFDLMSEAAKKAGLRAELVMEGEHWDYLARLTKEY